MVDVNLINEKISVSGQITIEDIPAIAEQGVQVLICNRPDNEAPDQPAYQLIEEAAKAQGLEVFNIPFAGGQMQAEHAEAFAELMTAGKRMHAYCRTGKRSLGLVEAANTLLVSK